MPKTSISLSDHFDGFISSQIANGRYDTASEVIRAALIAGENSGDSELQIDGLLAVTKQNRLT